MIEYINLQLSVWGKWAVRQNSKGLGYPSISPMFNQMQHGGSYGSSLPAGVSDCNYVRETDLAVQRLPEADRALCVEFYQVGGSAVSVAQRLGIARQRLYERLDAVHRAVMGHLNDIAAGA
jgi:DNA-binding NtrC family response regulator